MKPKRSYRPIVQKITMITIVLIILLVPTITFGTKPESNINEISIVFEPNKNPVLNEKEIEIENIETEIIDEVEEISAYEEILNEQQKLIEFYANLFNVPIDIIKNDLIAKSKDEEIIDINNLGYLKDENNILITHANIDLGLIAYFEDFLIKNPEYKTSNITPYTGNSEYVKSLIAYFTNVYTDVDYNIAITIGAAESGHYTAKSMLSVNNIFGGMYNKKLIRYHNIEYGVYRYIKLLNNNYFGKGLNTFETIGRYYCPKTINGVRQASPHWLSLVHNIKHKYEGHDIVTIEDVISLK